MNVTAEMKKRFPEWNEEPVQEFKCAMNDRTNRGSLVITPSGLYFYSSMLGGSKHCWLFDTVRELHKDGSYASGCIALKSPTGTDKFSAFSPSQQLDIAWTEINNSWERFKNPKVPEAEPSAPNPTPGENQQSEPTSLKAEPPRSNVAVPKPTIEEPKPVRPSQATSTEAPRPVATTSVTEVSREASQGELMRQSMRKRLQESEMSRLASETKRKELAKEMVMLKHPAATITKQTFEKPSKLTPQQKQEIIERLLRFSKNFVLTFVVLWICSFLISGLMIERISLQILVSLLFVSVDLSIDTRHTAVLLANLLMPFLPPNPSPKKGAAIVLGIVCLIHLLLVWIVAFLLDGVDIGFIAGILGVLVINSASFIKLAV